jgi:hypothetical protein
MIISYILVPALGAVAVVTSIATSICSLSFAIVLARGDIPISIVAIVACSLSVLGVLLLMFLLVEEYQKARTLHRSQGLEVLQRRWKRLPKFVTILCLLASTATIATLVWMQIRIADLPQRIIGATTQTLLGASFFLWSFSSLTQLLFLLKIILSDRRAARESPSTHTTSKFNHSAEMRETSRPVTVTAPHSRDKASTNSRPWSSGSRSGRKRSGSDTINSLRLSITQVVRPTSSKSRLISTSHSQKHHRPTSLDSGTGEREIIEDGFDSWDTSAVDAQSRQFVMSTTTLSISYPNTAPPSHSNSPLTMSPPGGGRFLETIPASPTTSRSPSPGFPLDLELPRNHSSHPSSRSGLTPRSRSRSNSPASVRSTARRQSHTESPVSNEAHIHPLFRTDSPTPPPSATPGTVVTAAPGAGLVISHHRSLHRMRSGSMPTSPSPLIYSNSLDDMRGIAASKNANISSNVNWNASLSSGPTAVEEPPEREMTPPIPEWILGVGRRGSMTGYARRKGPLVPVSERAELIGRERT